MSELSLEASGIAKAAERQMRRWIVQQQVQHEIDQEQAHLQLPDQIHPYVAVSRETGAGGSSIARELGRRLGWDVIDKELLDYMSLHYNLPHAMLESVDEQPGFWLWETFGKWLDHRMVTQTEYVVHLGHIVLMIAHHASAVFVGRGVQHLLPREKGLTVRITAELEERIHNTMQQQQCSHQQASTYVARCDKGRREFVSKFFHHDVADHASYDLVLDTSSCQIDDAVKFIMASCQRRFRVAEKTWEAGPGRPRPV